LPLSALALITVSALMHAAYHVLYKTSRDKQAFVWWLLAVTVVVYLPVVAALFPVIPARGWLLIVVSAVPQAAYFVFMSRAYDAGDLSLAYPLARGSAPLFIALWAALFLGERLALLGLAGVLVIILGLWLLNLPKDGRLGSTMRALAEPAARSAVLAALAISAYTTIDKVGVQYVPPLPYFYLVSILILAIYSAYLVVTGQVQRLAICWRAEWRGLIPSGIAMTLCYVLVLRAMQLSLVSYVGSVREISVVFGAVLGAAFMKERYGLPRAAASILVVAGVLLIALARAAQP